jgi:hypothetical protein
MRNTNSNRGKLAVITSIEAVRVRAFVIDFIMVKFGTATVTSLMFSART